MDFSPVTADEVAKILSKSPAKQCQLDHRTRRQPGLSRMPVMSWHLSSLPFVMHRSSSGSFQAKIGGLGWYTQCLEKRSQLRKNSAASCCQKLVIFVPHFVHATWTASMPKLANFRGRGVQPIATEELPDQPNKLHWPITTVCIFTRMLNFSRVTTNLVAYVPS